MNVLLDVLVGVLSLTGAGFVLVAAIAILQARDGLSRINVLSTATGVGMPALVLAIYLYHAGEYGFHVVDLIKALVAIAGFVIMSSVASNALGRAAYRSGAPLDPRTDPNDLA